MQIVKKAVRTILLIFIVWAGCALIPVQNGNSIRQAYAEKEEFYTSSEEFLPLGVERGHEGEDIDLSFLEDENLIHRAKLAGIKFLKDEHRFIFAIKAHDPVELEGKQLKYDITLLNFPPRVVLTLYGVTTDETIYRFFQNLDVRGIVRNPFVDRYFSEYVLFFEDWISARASYDSEGKRLMLDYSFNKPEYTHGFGIRIADTKIDPLNHIIEIKKELTKFGLENHILIASDKETVVLESSFFKTRDEAIQYMEKLESFGYNGKLARRGYQSFPKPHRFDVVSEVVITGEGDVELRNIVYNELTPGKIYPLNYTEIHLITKEIFSPTVQNDEEAIAEYYYELSEIYMNYETDDKNEKDMAYAAAQKLLEIIYFKYPKSDKADDALWEIANIIREFGISDILGEKDCYQKIIDEYQGSIFIDESKKRLENFKLDAASSRSLNYQMFQNPAFSGPEAFG